MRNWIGPVPVVMGRALQVPVAADGSSKVGLVLATFPYWRSGSSNTALFNLQCFLISSWNRAPVVRLEHYTGQIADWKLCVRC